MKISICDKNKGGNTAIYAVSFLLNKKKKLFMWPWKGDNECGWIATADPTKFDKIKYDKYGQQHQIQQKLLK